MKKVKGEEPGTPFSIVTGGAGFLGSHLCDRLIAEGHEVLCLDNLCTGRRENIQHVADHARFSFIEQDITKPFDFDSVLAGRKNDAQTSQPLEERPSYIWQLASPASPKDYFSRPIQTLLGGSFGTHQFLELARRLGSRVLIASTSEVYGDPKVNPQPETYWGNVNPVGPRSVYDEAKRFAEALTVAFHREYGLPVRIARIFNTYGERMQIDDGRVLPNFMMQALQNKPLTIYGDGTQTRSLCYVSDLVEGLCRLMASDETGPVNIGSPEEVSVNQLAQEVIEYTNCSSTITYEPLPVDDPKRRRPDISKAAAVLGWGPKVSRAEGIQRVIPYFKSEVEVFCAQ